MFGTGFPDDWSALKRLIWLRLKMGVKVLWNAITGISPLSLLNASSHSIKRLTQYGKLSVSGSTITCNNGELKVVNNEIVADGTSEEIVVQGKNLLSYEGEAVPYNNLGVSITRNENVYKVSVSDDATGYPYVRICTLHGIKSGTYTIKTYGTEGQSTLGARIVNRQVSSVLIVGQEGTFTVSADVTDDLDAEICLTSSSSVAAGDYYLTVQFEKGGTATEYQPPHHETATAENLFAVDDIVDEQDIITGKVIRRTEAVVSDGTTPSGRYIGEVGEGNIIVKARETGYSGEIVSFTTEEETPLTGLRVNFEPIQDLHGYDAPWPAGGGKNKLSMPDETFVQYKEVDIDPIPAGEYVFSAVVTSNDTDSNICSVIFVDSNGNNIGSIPMPRSTGDARVNSPLTLTATAAKIRLYAANGFVSSEGDTATFKEAQVEAGSTATSYAPYSNICPIYGHTDADVTRTGANIGIVKNLYVGGGSGLAVGNDGILVCFNCIKGQTYRIGNSSGNRNVLFKFRGVMDDIKSGASMSEKVSESNLPLTFTADETCIYCYYRNNTWSDTIANSIMVSLGSTASAYSPYVGTTYPVTFGALGKNLNPYEGVNYTADTHPNGIFLKAGTYIFSLDTGVAFGYNHAMYIKLKDENGNVITKGNISGDGWQLNGSETYYYGGGDSNIPKPFNLLKDCYVCFGFNNQYPTDGNAVQLELGSTATAYEPYNDTVYGGYYDFVNGKLVGDRAIVDLGAILWTYTTRFISSAIQNIAKAALGNGYKANILCDTYKAITANDVYNGLVGVALNTTPQIWFRDGIHTGTDLNNGVAPWLNGVKLVYELATPIVYQLSPQAIETLRGLNNVWSNGKSVNVYVSDGELIVQVTPQKLKTSAGDNTLTVTANVDDIMFDIEYAIKE